MNTRIPVLETYQLEEVTPALEAAISKKENNEADAVSPVHHDTGRDRNGCAVTVGVGSTAMDRQWAQQQLAAQTQERARLIQGQLQPGEKVIDAGEVNELGMNTMQNLGAGEALLFVTDRRLILYRSGRSESWPYASITSSRLGRAPRGVPQRRHFRELTLNMSESVSRSMIGGFMFLSAVKAALPR